MTACLICKGDEETLNSPLLRTDRWLSQAEAAQLRPEAVSLGMLLARRQSVYN